MNVLWAAIFTVTSYCLQGTRTASGTIPHFGTVATGPQFAFGTRLLVDGWPDVLFVVEDRGVPSGAVDVWVGDCGSAIRWGRRVVRVTVLADYQQPAVDDSLVGEEPEDMTDETTIFP